MTCSLRSVTSGRPAKMSDARSISVISKPPVTGLLKKYRPTTSTQVSSIRQNIRTAETRPSAGTTARSKRDITGLFLLQRRDLGAQRLEHGCAVNALRLRLVVDPRALELRGLGADLGDERRARGGHGELRLLHRGEALGVGGVPRAARAARERLAEERCDQLA